MNYRWKPIETAPTSGKLPIFIADIHNNEIRSIGFNAMLVAESESWEIPEVYYFWQSDGDAPEEPTHWCEMPELPVEVQEV